MTPDARPPSDETRATGWHTHGTLRTSAWRDGEWGCEQIAGPSRPVLVVDPADAREKIAEILLLALDGDLLPYAGLGVDNQGEDVPLNKARPKEVAYWAADALAAALTTQEPTT